MAYVKYKELTKFFDFSEYLKTEQLPWYVHDYVYENEQVLASYKTFRDHGVFTTDKILLFDNAISVRPFKGIYTIPYSSISSCLITYRQSGIELKFDLISGYQLILKFVGMHKLEKARLRLIYYVINRTIMNKPVSNEILDELINDKLNIKEG